MNGILYKAIWKELLPPFFLALIGFSFALLSMRMVDLLELVVGHGIPWTQTLLGFLYLLPSQLIFVLPMSLLVSILVAWTRIVSENESIAWRALGYKLSTLSRPFFLFSFMIFLATLAFSISIAPRSYSVFRHLIQTTAKTYLEKTVRPQVFTEISDRLVLYVNEIDSEGSLRGVLISDEREPYKPFFVVAEEGRFHRKPEIGRIEIELQKGILLVQQPQRERCRIIHFSRYLLGLSIAEAIQGEEKKIEELLLSELKQKAEESEDPQKERAVRMEWHRRFALPVACLIFAAIGIGLGARIPPRSTRARGFGLSLLVFLLYYIALTWSRTVVLKEGSDPALMTWLPNLVFGIVGVAIYHRAKREPVQKRGGRRP